MGKTILNWYKKKKTKEVKRTMTLEHLNESNFETAVKGSGKPVLVDFFATWCGPCKMLGPVLEELAGEMVGQADFYKLDIDEAPDIANRFGVMSVPTLILFQDGQEIKRTLGFQPKSKLKTLFD